MKFKMKLVQYSDDKMYAVMEAICDPGEPHTVVKEFEVDVEVDQTTQSDEKDSTEYCCIKHGRVSSDEELCHDKGE